MLRRIISAYTVYDNTRYQLEACFVGELSERKDFIGSVLFVKSSIFLIFFRKMGKRRQIGTVHLSGVFPAYREKVNTNKKQGFHAEIFLKCIRFLLFDGNMVLTNCSSYKEIQCMAFLRIFSSLLTPTCVQRSRPNGAHPKESLMNVLCVCNHNFPGWYLQ